MSILMEATKANQRNTPNLVQSPILKYLFPIGLPLLILKPRILMMDRKQYASFFSLHTRNNVPSPYRPIIMLAYAFLKEKYTHDQ